MADYKLAENMAWLQEYGRQMQEVYKDGWHALPDPGKGKVCSFAEMEAALLAAKEAEQAPVAEDSEEKAPLFGWAPISYDQAAIVTSGSYTSSGYGSGEYLSSGAYNTSGSYTGSGAYAGLGINMTSGVFGASYTGSGYKTYAAAYATSGALTGSGLYTTSGMSATSGAYSTSGYSAGSYAGSYSGSYSTSGYYMTSGGYTGSGYFVTSGSYAYLPTGSGAAVLTSGIPSSAPSCEKEEYDTTLKFSSYGLNLLR